MPVQLRAGRSRRSGSSSSSATRRRRRRRRRMSRTRRRSSRPGFSRSQASLRRVPCVASRCFSGALQVQFRCSSAFGIRSIGAVQVHFRCIWGAVQLVISYPACQDVDLCRRPCLRCRRSAHCRLFFRSHHSHPCPGACRRSQRVCLVLCLRHFCLRGRSMLSEQ